MFGMEPFGGTKPQLAPFLNSSSLLLANARSGIHVLAEALNPPRVWMPSYLCGTMLQGIDRNRVEFYPIDRDLQVTEPARAGEGDLVVIVDYFGFPPARRLFEDARSRGAWILEDACQALLTEGVGKYADFVLFSPRKYLGVPDGGILNSNTCLCISDIQLSKPPAEWSLRTLDAAVLRGEFDRHGGDRSWFSLFQESERDCPVGYFQMSETAREVLQFCDYEGITRRRRRNYALLLGALSDMAIYADLPDAVTPVGFPIRARNRDSLRQALFAHQIYPPVHWQIAGVVPDAFKECHLVSSEIMTLPCDQRYTTTDMEWMAEIVQRVR
jgi:dTDP-4-amino-4,6-dideoxygalactose transaminase